MTSASAILLRDAVEDDLPVFFQHQNDADSRWMAAFTSKDPTNQEAFISLWTRFLSDPGIIIKTIIADGQIAGSFMGYDADGHPEVSYWLGRNHWGQGIATCALSIFLTEINTARPIFARAAKDNIASLRVLEKCGFTILSQGRGFANARNEEIEEYLLRLSCASSVSA